MNWLRFASLFHGCRHMQTSPINFDATSMFSTYRKTSWFVGFMLRISVISKAHRLCHLLHNDEIRGIFFHTIFGSRSINGDETTVVRIQKCGWHARWALIMSYDSWSPFLWRLISKGQGHHKFLPMRHDAENLADSRGYILSKGGELLLTRFKISALSKHVFLCGPFCCVG